MTSANDPWGRVDADGTVYVRTAEGEREIGSWQAGSPEEALAFYRRKFASLATEVSLLEQRITTTDLSPSQARAAIERLQAAVTDAHAIGDLGQLQGRLEALTGKVDERQEEVRAQRGLAGTLGRVAQRRHSDRREDSDDRHHDEELEQREAGLADALTRSHHQSL